MAALMAGWLSLMLRACSMAWMGRHQNNRFADLFRNAALIKRNQVHRREIAGGRIEFAREPSPL